MPDESNRKSEWSVVVWEGVERDQYKGVKVATVCSNESCGWLARVHGVVSDVEQVGCGEAIYTVDWEGCGLETCSGWTVLQEMWDDLGVY